MSVLEFLVRSGATLTAISLSACSPRATVDAGSTWIAPASPVASMQWTSDSQTLLYTDYEGDLSAVDLGSRSPRKLTEGVGAVHLVKTSSGDVVFFLRPVAGSVDEVTGSVDEYECVQTPLTGKVLGASRIVATAHAFSDIVVSAQGEAVAFLVEKGVMVVDVATGDSRVVAMDVAPVAFAPNASSLFGVMGPDYVVIERDGKATPAVEAASGQVQAVTRWDADFPREVIVPDSDLLDVATGEKRALLPGIQTNARSFAGVSGDALRPAAAYVWQEECLHYTHVGQPPIEVCGEPQATLHRIDLETQGARPVASMPEIRLLAVSPDGLQLATFNDDGHTLKPQIDLKGLPPL